MFLRRAVVRGRTLPIQTMSRRIKSREPASRINHRNCIGSDDETNIGNGPFISARHKFHHARVNEKPPVRFR